MKRLFKTFAATAVAASIAGSAFASSPTESAAVVDWRTKTNTAIQNLTTPVVSDGSIDSILVVGKSEIDAAVAAAMTPRMVTYNMSYGELQGSGTTGGGETTTSGSTGTANFGVQKNTVQTTKDILTLGDSTDWQKVIDAVRKYATGAEAGQLNSIQANDKSYYEVVDFANPSMHSSCDATVPAHHLASTHGSNQKNNWGVIGNLVAYGEQSMYNHNCLEARDLENAKANVGQSVDVTVLPSASKDKFHGTAIDAAMETNSTIDDYIKLLVLLHNRPAELNR